MIETDSPFLRPRDLAGANRRNEPANLAHILDRVAAWVETTPQDLARTTTATAEAFFGLSGNHSPTSRVPIRPGGVHR